MAAGIFSTLGVVVAIAGAWTWLSFLVAGLIALAAGYSYGKLAEHYGEGGGAFTFLRKLNAQGFAGSLSWVLIVGYVLTNAVYAYTFGQYVGNVAGLGAWFPRVVAVAIMAAFIGLNLRGVGEAGGVEVFLVWFKLVVLVALAGWGLARWDLPMLSQGAPDAGIAAALFGAAAAPITLLIQLTRTDPAALALFLALVLLAVFGRPVILRHMKSEDSDT